MAWTQTFGKIMSNASLLSAMSKMVLNPQFVRKKQTNAAQHFLRLGLIVCIIRITTWLIFSQCIAFFRCIVFYFILDIYFFTFLLHLFLERIGEPIQTRESNWSLKKEVPCWFIEIYFTSYQPF